MYSEVVRVKMPVRSIGPMWGVKQAQISSWFCSCYCIKWTFLKTAVLQPFSCLHRKDLCLWCCLIPLSWAGCWSLNLSPDRCVRGGGNFDQANDIKNVLSFHFVPFYLCFSALWCLPSCCDSLLTRRSTSPPASIQSNGWLVFCVFGSVLGTVWPMAAAAAVTVLWSIAEALGPGFSFNSSITAGCTGEVKIRRTLMGMKILRRQRIPVVPNMFSLQSCGMASEGVSFHYFQSQTELNARLGAYKDSFGKSVSLPFLPR